MIIKGLFILALTGFVSTTGGTQQKKPRNFIYVRFHCRPIQDVTYSKGYS